MKRLALTIVAIAALGLAGSALAAGRLSGKYKTVIHSTAFGGHLNGTWVINFMKAGHYRVTDDGHLAAHGVQTIKGNMISIRDQGKGACPTVGKYHFKLKSGKLTFTLIHDSTTGNCVGREAILLHHTFVKVK